MTYYRIPGRRVVHTQTCQRLDRALFRRSVVKLQKKPWGCTICDHCQALDARDKRAAKKQRPMAKRGK